MRLQGIILPCNRILLHLYLRKRYDLGIGGYSLTRSRQLYLTAALIICLFVSPQRAVAIERSYNSVFFIDEPVFTLDGSEYVMDVAPPDFRTLTP